MKVGGRESGFASGVTNALHSNNNHICIEKVDQMIDHRIFVFFNDVATFTIYQIAGLTYPWT